MSRTDITQKFKMSLLFEKWKKQTNKQQQRQRLTKTDWNVHRLTWLILRTKGPWTSNKLLIDSKKCNPDFRIALAHRFDWILHNFKCRTFKLNCNKASASHYNDCLGTRSKESSFASNVRKQHQLHPWSVMELWSLWPNTAVNAKMCLSGILSLLWWENIKLEICYSVSPY